MSHHLRSNFRYPTVKTATWPFFSAGNRSFPKWWPVHAFDPIIERDPFEGWNLLFWIWLYIWVTLGRILKLGKKKDGSG